MTSEEPSEQDERVTVAAFDFDGTITRGGSTFQFLIQVRGLLPVAAATIRMLPKILHAGIVGGTAADDTKELLFIKLFGGQSADRVQRAGRHFAEGHIRRRLRPEVRTRIEWHRQQGHKVLLVSASVEQYVVPAGDLLG